MIVFEPRRAPSRLFSMLSPVIAILLTMLFTGLLMASMGKEPLEALRVYFLTPLADSYNRSELLVKAVPLMVIASGLAICFRANVWNIGAAGQYVMGAVSGAILPIFAPDLPAFLMIPGMVLLSVVGGMFWGAIPAFLKVRFHANEILTSLMLTYIAGLFLDWLVRGPWNDPQGYGFPQTVGFPDAASFGMLVSGTRLHYGVPVAFLIALVLWFVLTRTVRGFSVQVLGKAPKAGRFAGFDANGAVYFSFLLSGGLAGFAGLTEVAANIGKLQPDISAGYGFTAIIAAFLGRLNPLGAIIAALVLAVSYIGGENAQIFLKIPKSVTGLIQGMLLFFLLACDALITYRVRLVGKAGEAGGGDTGARAEETA